MGTRTARQVRISTRSRLAGLVLCVLSASIGTSAANVALPEIAAAFGGSFARAQWVVVVYLLAMTAASVAVGSLGDVLGRARLLAAGAVVFTVAAVVCAAAPSFEVLVAARAVQGAGAAVMLALPLALLRDTVAEERTGRVMGLLGTASALGTAAGPVLGGLAAGAWGWPAVFAMMVPFGIASLILGGVRSIDAARPGSRPRFDLAGALVLTAAVALYSLAVTGLGRPDGGPATAALFGASAVGVVVLVLIERRAAHPVLPLRLLLSRTMSASALANLVVGAVMMSTLVVGPFYLSGALGLTPAGIGLVMATGPIASIVSGVVAGRLVDRHGPRRVVAGGLATMIASALVLASLPGWIGLAGYVAGVVALAPGYQLFLAGNNTRTMTAVGAERRGTASGLLSVSRNVGLITGTTAMGALFTAVAGSPVTGASTPDLTAAMATTFVVAAGILAGALLVVSLPDRSRAAGD
ncbi:MFS transporter [Myceligenerans indicum]|uniref:MFS transporter n=1 Tax=Myceligenerans indicum TaxID=2593663 RepID=A0ABS1LFN5_9MICO|nr:MFS transporter [Myceligenerans indicum]MBL0884968.1 MFS transporter [Myceligenerans indicum]